MLSGAVINVLFYVLAAMAILFAVAVVCCRRILRAAVCLMGVLAMSAGFYVLLGAEFLAGVQILVYVGGIVVLMVFAIMLTASTDMIEERPSLGRKSVGLLAAGGFLAMAIPAFYLSDFSVMRETVVAGDATRELGRHLLSYGPEGFVLPFEMVSLLLLGVAIGGIVLARKRDPVNKV